MLRGGGMFATPRTHSDVVVHRPATCRSGQRPRDDKEITQSSKLDQRQSLIGPLYPVPLRFSDPIKMLAREGIEPPTRRSSVPAPKRAKYLNAPRKLPRKCPIFGRDSAN